MKIFLRFAFGLAALTLLGCSPAPAPATQPVKVPASNNGTGKTTDTGLSDIQSSAMMVTKGSSLISIAAIAKNSTADIVVFQFYGVTCLSCREEGPFVSSALSKFGSKVQTYVLFPNRLEEYKASDYESFSSKYAQNSPYVVDGSLEVLKKIRANNSQYFGIYLVVSKDGRGTALTMDGAYKSVESTVQQALGN